MSSVQPWKEMYYFTGEKCVCIEKRMGPRKLYFVRVAGGMWEKLNVLFLYI